MCASPVSPDTASLWAGGLLGQGVCSPGKAVGRAGAERGEPGSQPRLLRVLLGLQSSPPPATCSCTCPPVPTSGSPERCARPPEPASGPPWCRGAVRIGAHCSPCLPCSPNPTSSGLREPCGMALCAHLPVLPGEGLCSSGAPTGQVVSHIFSPGLALCPEVQDLLEGCELPDLPSSLLLPEDTALRNLPPLRAAHRRFNFDTDRSLLSTLEEVRMAFLTPPALLLVQPHSEAGGPPVQTGRVSSGLGWPCLLREPRSLLSFPRAAPLWGVCSWASLHHVHLFQRVEWGGH